MDADKDFGLHLLCQGDSGGQIQISVIPPGKDGIEAPGPEAGRHLLGDCQNNSFFLDAINANCTGIWPSMAWINHDGWPKFARR